MSEEKIINGIDVSECEFYEEMRELPDNLNGGYYIQHCYCGLQGDNYCICNKNPDCYFKQLKRLQEENEKLKKKKDEYYLINLDYETKISYLIQALEEINILAKNYCNACDEFKAKTYKALEEIRKEANRLLYEENPIYGYNNSNYFELLAKYVLAKTKEALNGRD